MENINVVEIRDTDNNTVYPKTHTGCQTNFGDKRYDGQHLSLIPNTYLSYKFDDMNVPSFVSTNYWAGGLIVTPDKRFMLIFFVGGEVALYERDYNRETLKDSYEFVAKANLASYTGNHDTHHANCASLIKYDDSQEVNFGTVSFIVAVSKDSKNQNNDLVFEVITLDKDIWGSGEPTLGCELLGTITHDKSVHYDWVVDVNQNMAIGFSLAGPTANVYTMSYTGYNIASFLEDIRGVGADGSPVTVASTSLTKVFEAKTYELPAYQGAQGAYILNNMFFFLTDKQQQANEWYMYVFDWRTGDVLSRFTFDNSHEEEQEDICIVDNSIYRSIIYRTSSPKRMYIERLVLD